MQLVNGSWRGGLDDAGTALGVFAIATSKGDVYVGGSFHLAGDVIVHNIARWDGVIAESTRSRTTATACRYAADTKAVPYLVVDYDRCLVVA